MTAKAAFNAEEWSTVVDGPLYAGICRRRLKTDPPLPVEN